MGEVAGVRGSDGQRCTAWRSSTPSGRLEVDIMKYVRARQKDRSTCTVIRAWFLDRLMLGASAGRAFCLDD